MRAAVILSLASLALGSIFEKRASCHGNNCDRAITGTRDGLSPMSVRSADCKSYMLSTVTAAPTTVTVTVDEEDAAPTSKPARLIRDEAASTTKTLPTYAAVCSSSAAYVSACSCLGVTGSVTTVPGPKVTVTTTIDYCDDL